MKCSALFTVLVKEVPDIYIPMVHLLQMFMKTHHRLIAVYPDMDTNDEFVDDIECDAKNEAQKKFSVE